MKHFLKFVFIFFFIIEVGQSVIIKPQTLVYGNIRLRYCGMPSKTVFSIDTLEFRQSVNLFYPINVKQFNYRGLQVKVLEVTPEFIKIDVLDEGKKK